MKSGSWIVCVTLMLSFLLVLNYAGQAEGKHRTRVRYRANDSPNQKHSSLDHWGNARTTSDEVEEKVLKRGRENYGAIDKKHSYFENEIDKRQMRRNRKNRHKGRNDHQNYGSNSHGNGNWPAWKRHTNISFHKGRGNERGIQIHSLTE